jgi:hypothetical protein
MDPKINDILLKRLMKEVTLEKPSNEFSSKVMDIVITEASKKAVRENEAILGPKFWIFTGSFVLLALVFTLLGGSESGLESELSTRVLESFSAPDLMSIKKSYSQLLDVISGIPATLGAIMLATTALIFTDKIFSIRHSFFPG